MSEINNNKINVGNIQNLKSTQKAEVDKKPVGVYFEYTNFDNPKAEALGRSQVSAKVDNIENDLAFFMKNPNGVKQTNSFFDNAYETLKEKNVETPYEKAAVYSDAFKNEFLTK